ncbi:MAG: hypothetical protein KIT84_04850 [Labilithrix sp.]|nr:hypothetical protein [Labilithrix sp.]MCW5810315.1 hypothetical protein [Labilithrix sp.]
MRASVLLVVLPFLACAATASNDDGDDRTAAPGALPVNGGGASGSSNTPLVRDAGIHPPADPDVDLETIATSWNGKARSYLLARPRDYDPNRRYPLVMMFHGNPSTKETLRKQAPFELGSRRDAVLVYPDAAGGGWDLFAPPATNKDMDWIRALPQEIAERVSVDLERVYGFGFSGGGFFVSQMACLFGDFFRAISVNAGGAPDGKEAGLERKSNQCYVCPGGPVPTLFAHGNNDGRVPKTSAAFAAKCAAESNRCTTNEVKVPTTESCTRADACAAPVELCIIPNLGHDPWRETFTKSWAFFQSAP